MPLLRSREERPSQLIERTAAEFPTICVLGHYDEVRATVQARGEERLESRARSSHGAARDYQRRRTHREQRHHRWTRSTLGLFETSNSRTLRLLDRRPAGPVRDAQSLGVRVSKDIYIYPCAIHIEYIESTDIYQTFQHAPMKGALKGSLHERESSIQRHCGKTKDTVKADSTQHSAQDPGGPSSISSISSISSKSRRWREGQFDAREWRLVEPAPVGLATYPSKGRIGE